MAKRAESSVEFNAAMARAIADVAVTAMLIAAAETFSEARAALFIASHSSRREVARRKERARHA